ncbi:MAG: DUF2240 family protein [Methanomassiliicoccaceae archaeon]|jgi:hypothetical protein|nr:DUF2240 family protein [Methanomassiliicoccaceae archaeon]
MDELRFTAAAFFRNKGKNVVTENEFVMGISMDLRWVPPTDAKDVLSLLLHEGHLKKDGEYIRPAFDVHAVDVPLGFRPSGDLVLKAKRPKKSAAPLPSDDLLSELMAKAESLGMKRKDFVVSVNAIQKRLNVDIEVAALLMLRDNGIDIGAYTERAYEAVAKR